MRYWRGKINFDAVRYQLRRGLVIRIENDIKYDSKVAVEKVFMRFIQKSLVEKIDGKWMPS